MKFRIGQGIDVHPFEAGRKLILGGVEIPHTHGLKGHSDADALSHAICDALFGALALGDIGQHFSDKDPKNKDRSSKDFLKTAKQMIEEKGWKISNIDATLVAQEPSLASYFEQMQASLCKTLGLERDQMSIKATRPEKLGSLGRKEGLMVMAIALLSCS